MVSIVAAEDLPAQVREATEAGLLAAMIAGANGAAGRVARCLASSDPAPTDDQVAEAKLVLIGAIKRWSEAGSGGFQQQTAGPFSVAYDTRQRGGFNLWPSEIEQLQDICRSDTNDRRAFAIDQVQPADPSRRIGGYAVGDDRFVDRPDLRFQWE